MVLWVAAVTNLDGCFHTSAWPDLIARSARERVGYMDKRSPGGSRECSTWGITS
jgi:hypothetical protein